MPLSSSTHPFPAKSRRSGMISTGTCVAWPAAGSVPTIVNGYVVPPVVDDPDHVGTLTALAGNCSSGRNAASLARFSWKFDVEA